MIKTYLLIIIYLFTISRNCLAQHKQKTDPTYPKIRPKILTKGYIDSNGRIQGMIIGYDNKKKVIKVETLKDDIPNGYFFMLNQEGFYKNNKRDSIFYIYSHQDTSLIHAGFYKEGLKSGYFFDYYSNGQLSSEKFYRND